MHWNQPAVVHVAHENAVIEAGLRQILGASAAFAVGPPHDTPQAMLSGAGGPALAVLDHRRGTDWALAQPSGPGGRAHVLIVAMAGQELDVRTALEAGVRGYVLVGCPAEEIVDAARAVAAGRRHLCGTATACMADSLTQPALTGRENEILQLVSRGRNNKEVARLLDISVGTVKSHMRGLLAKLDARCRSEVLWIASQRGLVKGLDPLNAGDPVSPSRSAVATRRTLQSVSTKRLMPLLPSGSLQPLAAFHP